MKKLQLERRRIKCLDQSNCPLGKDCVNAPSEYYINPKNKSKHFVDILFVGEALGKSEHENKRLFIGISGIVLRRIINFLLKKYNFSYGFSNVVRGRPTKQGKNRAPTDTEIQTCGVYLEQELERVNPKIIVAVGKVPYAYLMSLHSRFSIFKERSCIRDIVLDKNKYKVIGTSHPSFFLRAKDKCLIGLLFTDIEKAVLYATKGIDLKIPNTFKTKLLTSVKQVEKTLDKLSKVKKKVAIDTEDENLNRVYENNILSVQLCNDGITGYVIPLSHYDSPFSPVQIQKIKKMLKDFFTNKKSKITGYIYWNAPYDLHQFFRELKILIPNAPVYDAQFGAYLLEENLTRLEVGIQPYSLGTQSYQHGFTLYQEREDMDKDNRSTMKDRPLKEWVDYAAADAVVTYNLFKVQLKEAKIQGYKKIYKRTMKYLGHKIVCLITYIEHCGMPINIQELRKLDSKRTSVLLKDLEKINQEFNKTKSVRKVNKKLLKEQIGTTVSLFGNPSLFDLSKRIHKEMLFFDHLKLKPLAEGKRGGKIDKEFKEKYKSVKEVKMYTEYDRIAGLYSLFVKNLNKKMSKAKKYVDFFTDYRVRSRYKTRTVTGRLKAVDPNLQQRVSHGDRADVILKIFASKLGRILIKVDYSVHEVRGLQIVSKDKSLKKTFNTVHKVKEAYKKDPTILTPEELKLKTDVHIQNASIFFDVPIEKVTKKQRQDNKGLIFGTIYGMSDKATGVRLGISMKKAIKLKKKIFDKLVEAAAWLKMIVIKAREELSVTGYTGRRRRLWGYLFPLNFKSIHSKMDRLGMNAPIQGISSDFSLIAGYLFMKYIFKIGKAKYQTTDELMWAIINLIHDSVEFEIPVKDLYKFLMVHSKFFTTKLSKHLKKYFNMNLEVNFEIDTEIGFDFGALTKFDGTKKHAKELQKWAVKEDKKRNKRG